MEWIRQDKETIAALATPVGEGGVGIIRISGPDTKDILTQIFVPYRQPESWRSHQLVYGHCVDEQGEWLDEVLAVWMAKGRSYTGEDVVEIQGHGGQLNMTELLRRVLHAGARLAQAGEFTRRAFLNGRIDLTRAEAIADMIAAKNEQALRIARHHLQGKLQVWLDALAEESIKLAAQVESWIDFPEEFDPALDQAVATLIDDIHAFVGKVRTLYDSYQQGQRFREGWSLVLLGRPNAGKSSLFNHLSGKDRAIVTHVPGTTRDLLDTQIALGGIQLTLTDSAGLRDTPEPFDSSEGMKEHDLSHHAIEQIGVSRALDAAQESHLILAVFDQSRPWSPEDDKVLQACQGKDTVVVLNKTDLPMQLNKEKLQQFDSLHTIEISCESGEGINTLREWMQEYTEQQTPSSEMVITNERQYQALREALQALEHALSQGYELGPEFMAEDLRAARQHLSHITGQVSSEDILDALFSRFCIGK